MNESIQYKFSLIATALHGFVGGALLIFAQQKHAIADTHFLTQCAFMLLATAAVCAVSAFHAYLSRMAKLEADQEVKLSEDESRFFNEDETITGRQHRNLNQYQNVFAPLFIGLISIAEIAGASWCISMQLNYDHAVSTPDKSFMLVPASLLTFYAVVNFLIGKYTAGLAYVDNRLFLRPVSSGTLFCSVIGIVVTIISLLNFWNINVLTLNNIFTYSLATVSILLAVERFVSWLIDLYRPRQKDEEQAPFYESNILSLFSQPKGFLNNLSTFIEYQFGFKISEKWLSDFFFRAVVPFFCLQILTLLILSSIVYVAPGQEAVVQQWGQKDASVLEPGVYARLPWPVSSIIRVEKQQIRQVLIEPTPAPTSETEDPEAPRVDLWANPEYNTSLFLANKNPVGSTPTPSLAAVRVSIQYAVSDSIKFAVEQEKPEELLALVARREVSQVLASNDLARIMHDGYDALNTTLSKRIQIACDQMDLGIEIVDANVLNLQVPAQIADSFQALMNETEKSSTVKLRAETYALQSEADSEQLENAIIRRAESDTAFITHLANAEISIYETHYKAYKVHPLLYMNRTQMAAMERWLIDATKIITTNEQSNDIINLDLKKSNSDILSLPEE